MLKKVITIILLSVYSFSAVPLFEYIFLKNIAIPIAKNVLEDIYQILKKPVKKYKDKNKLKEEIEKIMKYKKLIDEKIIYQLYKYNYLNLGLLKISFKLSIKYKLLLRKNGIKNYEEINKEDKRLLLLILLYQKKHKEIIVKNKIKTNNVVYYMQETYKKARNEIIF